MRDQANEIELKFELLPSDAQRLPEIALVRGTRPQRIEQSSTYFDTPRLRLRRQGLTLRIRHADGKLVQTVKAEGASRALFARGEWEYEVQAPEPDREVLARTPAGAVLLRKDKPAELRRMFTVDVQRTVWPLTEDSGEVELVLDTGNIRADDATFPISELEIELVRGDPALLFEIARAVAAAVPLRIGVLSKSERGARLIEGSADRVSKAEPVRLDPAMRADDAFVAIAWSCIRHFRLNETLLLATGDPEALHQSRVALRRLRSAFSLFARLIEGEESASIKLELRWAANLLGQARDLDVYIAAHPDVDAERARELADRRAAALDRALVSLESSRFRTLMIEIVRWLMLGRWRERALAAAPVREVAAEILERFRRKLRKAGGDNIGSLDDHDRHQVRIEAKKLRYGSEFFAALFDDGKASRLRIAFLGELERLQGVLGDLNDLATARTLHDEDGPPAEDPDRDALIANASEAYARLLAARPFWR